MVFGAMKKIGDDITPMDVVVGVGKAVMAQLPGANFFIEAVDAIKGNVLQRRFDRWQELVNKRIETLEGTVRNNLGDNESFATTLIKATELASQTNDIKVEYLANAVEYTASHPIQEDDLIILLNQIPRYTISHFKVLLYFQNPSAYNTKRENLLAGSPLHYFYNRYPDFDKSRATRVMNELFRDGLITTNSEGTASVSGINAKKTSELGDLFISFFGIKESDYQG